MIKDATYIAESIKNNQLSPIEALVEMEKRAKQNKELNAFIELDINKAKEHLTLVSQKKNHENMPFFGVPYPLKDLGQKKKNFKETYGSRLFKDNIANSSNHYTKRIEEAGFIPFGVTATPEFGFKNVTDSFLHGNTKNPFDKKRFSGGSSGGAAAVVASGINPIAGASDGGGSIRIPASFTGLIGLKPSRGLIVTGPDDYRNWQGASVNFGLTVSMRDTRQLLKLLTTNNQFSPFNIPRLPKPDRKRPLKIAVCTDSPVGNPVSDEAIKAVMTSANFFEQLGHRVELVDYPVEGDKLIRSYYQMNGGETAHLFETISSGLKRDIVKEDMELMTWALYQYGKKLTASDYISSFSEWDKATVTMETLFEEYDLFLSPTVTSIAPKIETDLQSDMIREKMSHATELNKVELAQLVYDMFEKSLWLTPYTQLANLTGQPAISLPTYQTPKEKLPIGIQLMASKGNDELLLEVGEWFEEKDQLKIPTTYHF